MRLTDKLLSMSWMFGGNGLDLVDAVRSYAGRRSVSVFIAPDSSSMTYNIDLKSGSYIRIVYNFGYEEQASIAVCVNDAELAERRINIHFNKITPSEHKRLFSWLKQTAKRYTDTVFAILDRENVSHDVRFYLREEGSPRRNFWWELDVDIGDDELIFVNKDGRSVINWRHYSRHS